MPPCTVRTVAYSRASDKARRSEPTEPMAEWIRVMFRTGVMDLTPSFSLLTKYASVPFKDSSAVGTICVPVLFLSLCTRIPLLVDGGLGEPVGRRRGRRRGTRKRDRERDPSLVGPVRARATATSLSVALENHLKPSNLNLEPCDVLEEHGVAIVSVCDTSEPPVRCITPLDDRNCTN